MKWRLKKISILAEAERQAVTDGDRPPGVLTAEKRLWQGVLTETGPQLLEAVKKAAEKEHLIVWLDKLVCVWERMVSTNSDPMTVLETAATSELRSVVLPRLLRWVADWKAMVDDAEKFPREFFIEA